MVDGVDHGDYAPGWNNLPEQENNYTLQTSEEARKARKAWVVLLEFSRNGSEPTKPPPHAFGQLTNAEN